MTDRSVRHWYSRWPMALWLAVVWVLLWGNLTLANAVIGVVLGFAVVTFAPLPRVAFEGRFWLPGVVVLLVRFAIDVVHASVQVAGRALSFGREPRGAVIRVRLRSHSDLFLTLTAEVCSLVPGSIIVEAHRLTGTLYVHVLDIEQAGGVAAAKAAVLEQERRVLYALASDADIAEAGLPPRGLLRAARAVAALPEAAAAPDAATARPEGPVAP